MRRLNSFLFGIGIFFLALFVPHPIFAYYTNMNASVVVGQTDFISTVGGVGNSKFFDNTATPTNQGTTGIFVDPKGRLIISDFSNARVLIWNQIPTTNGVPADLVLGQPNFDTVTANTGGRSASTMANSGPVYSDGNKLFVADENNSRVLIWNTFPTQNGQAADVVVGQVDFASAATTCNSSTLSIAAGISVYQGKLIIADRNHKRVLVWNTIPTANGQAADMVIGKNSFTDCSSGTASASNLASPIGVYVWENKLFVADTITQHRVLIWNSFPTTNNQNADVVLGQNDFTTSSSGASASKFNQPLGIAISDNRIFLTDSANNRVLIFNSIPTTNGASADIVLGQSDFTSNSVNQGGSASANSLRRPNGIFVYDNKLLVGDAINARVLIFSNTLPDTKLTNVLVSGEADGKQKLQGKASTNVVNGVVRYVEYSINGSTWTGATPSDGAFDEVEEDYSFVFDPKSNNPDIKNNEGFVVRVRNTHNNTVDSGSSAVYFEPFTSWLNQDSKSKPLDSNQSFGTNPLPSFSFSINTWRFEDLVKDLDSFRVSINKDNQGWIPYIENIPVSYEGVRDTVDNKRRSIVATSGNGVYEDTWKVVSYTSNNGTIAVQGKAVNKETGDPSDKDFFNGGMKLPAGTYQWRVEAVDRAGHVQATHEKTLYLSSFQKVVTKSWFPLTITSFTGQGSSLDWSSIHPQDVPSSITISTTQPMIKGIASVGATVTASFTNKICLARGGSSASCTISASTVVGGDSRYTLTSPVLLSGNDYTFIVSVTDVWGNTNRLPGMRVGVE